jgi:hypothetical protein
LIEKRIKWRVAGMMAARSNELLHLAILRSLFLSSLRKTYLHGLCLPSPPW